MEGVVSCSSTSVGGFEAYSGTGSSLGAGSTSGSAMRTDCSAAAGVAGVGGISLTTRCSIVLDSGDAVIASSPIKGEGPTGSEASAAASLAGLSAIGLGVVLSFPAGGSSVAALSDDGLDEPLMEVESESRSASEG